MAVEARHLNLFPSQLIQDMVKPMNQVNAYDSHQMRFLGTPFAAALPENQSLYQTAPFDSVKAKTSVNTDSTGITYNIPAPRKRSRDSADQYFSTPNFQNPSFLGEDILPQINQYQSEIDSLISQHTKKIRLELEERQKQQTRLILATIGEGARKKLKEKEEQIQRMGKLNYFLQERVKSLYIENQLWRDLAQSNEATANSLRSNLEQVLAHVGGDEHISGAAAEDDAESCCGSNNHGRDIERGDAQDKESGEGGSRRCKRCGERESCVLLLPCRHLCLCNVCGSGSQQLQTCPVCNCSMNATLHVNFS